MPPADHIQAELDRQRDKMQTLSDDVSEMNSSLQKEIANSRERIMNSISSLTQDQNRRIETLGADWNEKHTRVRIDVAVLKAKSALIGFLAGLLAPVLMWVVNHWAK